MKSIFIPIDLTEDIEIVAGKLVKNGHKVERSKEKRAKGNGFQTGIKVTINSEIKEFKEDEE